MNAVGMNPAAAGGPVGGMMMMNNGSPAVSAGNNTQDNLRLSLNTYIYEYLLKHGHYDIARTMANDGRFEMKTGPKQSPGRRKDGEINGDGEMDMDGKDDIPDDIPRPATWESGQGNGFLFEWYSIFQDLFLAHRMNGNKMNGANMNPAAQYLLQHQQMQRLRENQQNQNLNRTGMVNQAMLQRMQQNGMMNNPEAQRAMAAGKMTPQQMQQMQKQRAQMMQQMQGRDQQEGEMNGRPGTPAEGDAVGSPSKRPRIDNGQQQFTNGMMQNGRPAGMPGAANQGMILQAGFPNAQMNPQFPRNGNMPPKAMQGGMANGMMNIGSAGSPMMQGMSQFPEGMQMDYRNTMQANQPMQAGGGPQSGNHALQDYQMQLMLLEQQNKKRLMMARQEQNENNPGTGPMPGVNMPAPGLSPGGSRTGTSPNPGDQMKRNPGMGGLPGSPSAADGIQGRSPAGMGFMNGMPGPDFNNAMFMGGKDQAAMMAAGGPGMRPPTSADMNVMRQQGGRVNQPFPGGQPMVQQASQGGQQAMGTPGQRNEMPPPQAPPGGSAQRNQGASPSGNNAPPTPSQSNKANPKAKKGAKAEDNKKRPTKKNSTANAPTSDDNPPATPTTSTPITSNNAGAMNNAAKGQAGMQAGGQQQVNPAMQMNNQQMQHTDLGPSNQFGDYGANDNFNLDFTTLENADVLENFDFDSFLNTSADDAFNFDAGIDVNADFNMNQTE